MIAPRVEAVVISTDKATSPCAIYVATFEDCKAGHCYAESADSESETCFRVQRLTNQQWPRSLRGDWPVWLLQRNLDTHACFALHLRVYKYNASTLEGHTRRAHWKGTLKGHTQRAHLEGHGHMRRSLNMPSGPGNEVNRYNKHQEIVPGKTGQRQALLGHSSSLWM